ncbi:MAG: class I SAM-dependent methyltransferase [Candidatus Omnitrophica bacterium]|nr:class I SAM-dependent methyltransferase [Candidatus Omnitrophota bacterium]
MKVDGRWWMDFFNKIYLVTDYRTVCDHNLTRKEVSLLESILKPGKKDDILDICGGYGRHSLEMAKRGYRNLTVLDFSGYMINVGKKIARQGDLNVKFLKRDARRSGLKSGKYSFAFIMANSFGYFPEDRENLKILAETHRVLKKGGKLLLDLADPCYVKNMLKPRSWHEADRDMVVCRERNLKNDFITVRELVISKSKGLVRDGRYCEKLYDRGKISELLKTAGFVKPSVRNSVSLGGTKKDYGLMSARMFVTALKP